MSLNRKSLNRKCRILSDSYFRAVLNLENAKEMCLEKNIKLLCKSYKS